MIEELKRQTSRQMVCGSAAIALALILGWLTYSVVCGG